MKKKSIVLVLILALVLVSALTITACKEPTVQVEQVTLDRDTLSLVVGTSGTLVATVLPENATDKSVTWSSGNTNIATVDANGTVAGVAVGETTVTVTTVDGEKTATAEIIVTAAPVAVTGFAFNKSSVEMSLNGEFQLKPVFTPKNATNGNFSAMVSSNTNVVTVGSSGWISAVGVGVATVTATSEDGGFTATCEFRVVNREGVLVVGYSPFNSKFSPFFSKTAYDQDVALMTQVSLLTTDREGNIVYKGIDGETIAYNGTDYTYYGIANVDITIGQETTLYEIEIRDDIEFSDGTPMTIDDVIFTMYVLCDPTYTGGSTLYSTNIQGMQEYRTNGIDMSTEAQAYITELSALAEALVEGEKELESLTDDEQEMIDWAVENLQDTSAWSSWAFSYPIAQYISWGYGNENSTDQEVYDAVALDEILGGFFPDYAPELKETKAIQLALEYIALHPEEEVKKITGIRKTGEYTMEVVTDGFEATTIYQLGFAVAPLHYYGETAKYDYDNDKFGFDKADLSHVESKTTSPMGAGAYKFVEFKNGIVTFEANENYYKGEPKIGTIQFRETNDADKISGVIAGTFDITDPSFSNAAVTQVKDINSNGELSGNVIYTNLVDNLGYGYIGINAGLIKVGSDPSSDASKNFRKAYATLFAVYREVVVNSYYGDRAVVINYPISNTSWAAPRPTDDGYQIAYSKDKDGNPIYTASMSAEQKYAAALDAAKGFLTAAGFTYNSSTGKFTDVPTFTAAIPADGTGDHPAFGILTYVKEALATIGVEIQIQDYSDSNEFFKDLDADALPIWCAAWQATPDPDMYQVYHSSNVVGETGSTGSNHYRIQDDELDSLILAARQSEMRAFRKTTYKQCLDIIMDWGVEIPTYQRKNALVFSAGRVNLDTLTPDITTFWGWMNDIEELEMK